MKTTLLFDKMMNFLGDKSVLIFIILHFEFYLI